MSDPLTPEELTPVLDVHPPHEPIHGWRDFLLHLFTITVGLCIALALEGLVEFAHHRHIVREARENIRHEIELNHRITGDDLVSIQQAVDRMQANIDTIHRLEQHPKEFKGSLHFTLEWDSFNDSAWHSARDMGALTYMPYADVQNFADLYGQQEIVRGQALDLYNHQAYAAAALNMYPSPTDLSPADVHTLLHDSASTLIGLKELHQILGQLDAQYTAALKQP